MDLVTMEGLYNGIDGFYLFNNKNGYPNNSDSRFNSKIKICD
jgi:hypothetical protein